MQLDIEEVILIKELDECFDKHAPWVDRGLYMSSTKDYKVLGVGPHAARAGVHGTRARIANKIQDLRRTIRGYQHPLYTLDFEENGIVVIEDFFGRDVAEDVLWEIKNIPMSVSKQNYNLLRNLKTRVMSEIFKCAEMKSIVLDCMAYEDSGEAAAQYENNLFVQKIRNCKEDNDVQKWLHMDTFFPCVKWWYFPHDVKEDEGPFAYAPGSHKFTPAKEAFINQQSIDIEEKKSHNRTYGHDEGSLRILENELEAMGHKVKKYPVKADTLVIANVHGFHRRSEVVKDADRFAIHGSIRFVQPFRV